MENDPSIIAMNNTLLQNNIPKGWSKTKFDKYIKLCYGANLPDSKRVQGDFPVFGSNGIVGNHNNFLVKGPGIIVGRKGTIGAIKWIDKDFWPIDTTYFVEADNTIYLPWLYYELQSLGLNKMNSGSATPGLSREDVYKLSILVPPNQEQEKIAQILLAVDMEINKADELVSKGEKLKKGLVAKLFLDHRESKKYKIKDVSEVTSSKRVMVSDYVEEGVPFYRSTEIIKKSKNIPITNPYYISFNKFLFFKNRFGAPEAGDILVTAVGTIGDVYLVQNETFYFKDGNSVWIRKIKETVLPEYFKMILSSSFYREKLNNVSGGSSQKALTIQKLENVEIPVPSIVKQKELIKVLASVDEKLNLQKQLKEKLTQLKRGLMSDLLSGKVRVK